MTRQHKCGWHWQALGACQWLALITLMTGCADRSPTTQATADAPVKGRAQMWSENCIRCHNARSPAYYSDREWDVAMQHMFVRCYLTAKETREIAQFIQSAND